MTADSVFVLSHDMDIARCSNGKGRVNDMTYEQLLAYDFGSWKGRQFVGEKIARLDDLLDYFKEKGLIIELDLADETRFKRQWIPPLYELVKRKGMLGQTMFTATQDEFSVFLSESRDIVISVSGVTNMTTAQRALPMSKNVLLCNYSIHYNNLTDKIVDYAHTNGIKVKTWTIVSESKLRECVDIGVDYIITELPPEPWPWEDEGQTSIIPIMAD